MTEIIDLADGWSFYRNDATEPEPVRVPHDAMLGEHRSPDAPMANAGAYFHGGSYRYERDIDAKPLAGKTVLLELDGVMGDASVLVDGVQLSEHVYGYTGWTTDLSAALANGDVHTLQVVADTSAQPASRWYAGSGMYRAARLVVQDQAHIVRGGVRVGTLSAEPARIAVDVAAQGGRIHVLVEDAGKAVAEGFGSTCELFVPNTQLWDAENPHLYQLHVLLEDEGGAVLDEAYEPFGIRTLAWGRQGFLVNGKPVKLKGGCVHHTHGILGATDLPEACQREVELLKEWGFNALRSAHNPLSPAMLRACDELGLYVMDEFADMWYRHKNPCDYALHFDACWRDDLAAMVAKDYNHPCVVMYSIGNENAEPHEQRGVDTAHELATYVRGLDPSRPVTAGVNSTILWATSLGIDSFNADGEEGQADASAAEAKDTSLAYNTYVAKMGAVMEAIAASPMVGHAVRPYLNELDIAGYNYGVSRYRKDLRVAPDRPVVGAETMPYDLARNWRLVQSDARIIGDFMWTSLDYLGECSLAAWSDDPTPVAKPYPWLCADTGALDLVGNPNGEAALAKAVWCDPTEPLLYVRPLAHTKTYKAPWRGTNSVPCWSWAGCEGLHTVAEIYTQAPIVKLYLNGRHLGTKRTHDCHANFALRYEPGELVAVSCTSGGLELGRSVLRSAGPQLGLALELERRIGEVAFVHVNVADAAGVVEAGREHELRVQVEGGELLAFGSAAQKSELSYLSGRFTTRYGRALAVVRAGAESCLVRAEADGLGATELSL